MVEWCDDERDTKASYGGGESHQKVISFKEMIRDMHTSHPSAGFNEVVYKEIVYDYTNDEQHVASQEERVEEEEDEKNADLLLSKKFADS